MKTRYDAFYHSMPGLDPQKVQATTGAEEPVRLALTLPHPVSRQPSVLESRHPEIVQAITLLWGYPEMNQYFEKIWLDDGSGAPIEPEAMSELMLLAGVHGWLAPQRPVRDMASIYDVSRAPRRRSESCVWDEVPRRR